MLPKPRSRLVVDGVVETVYDPVSAPHLRDVLSEMRQPKPAPAIEEIKPRCPCGAVEGACSGACIGCC